MLYKDFAKYYDLVYSNKNYQKEANFIDEILKKHTNGESILDIACGTGNHAKLLVKKGYKIMGIDKNKEVLSVFFFQSFSFIWISIFRNCPNKI